MEKEKFNKKFNEKNNFVSFIGYSNSGKTISIEVLIKYLTENKISAFVFKHIHKKNFSIDTPGKNTWRFSKAGAEIVVSQSEGESAVIFNWALNPLTLSKVLIEGARLEGKLVDNKRFVLLYEGFRDFSKNQILCVSKYSDIPLQFNESIIAISGAIFESKSDLKKAKKDYKVPFINVKENPEKLLNLLFNLN